MAAPVVYSRRVRFSDIDCQGHVFNANYMVYFDDAITDYMDALELPYAEMSRRGHDMVLVRAECDFRSSGELGETLQVGVRVSRIGTTSLTFALEITEGHTARRVAEGREVYVILDRPSRSPTPVPTYLREAVTRLQGGEPE